jgi:threonine/homoserine/homoserine lactone efflux protein
VSNELFAAFVVFAVATLITPGPNNVMLMTSGVNYGFQRTLPHVLGVDVGFGFMVAVVGVGLGAIFAAVPMLYTVLKFVAVAYLLYLAWKIANAGPVEEGGTGRPFSFLQAAAFQWVNPKGWIMAIGAVTTYAAIAAFPFNILLMVIVFVGFGLISSLTWLLFGTGLRRIVTEPKTVRIFNISMAVLLAASLVPVLFEG